MEMVKSKPELLCSICLEQFRSPKLLACRHTFCSKCLKNYTVSVKEDESVLTCPLCRSSIYIPPEGVSGFLSNYFVNADIMTDGDTSLSLCANCSEDCGNIAECRHCENSFCTNCMKQHNQEIRRQRRLSRPRFGSDLFLPNFSDSDTSSSSSSSDSSTTRDPHDVDIPYSVRSSLYPVRTKVIVSLLASFQINNTGEDNISTVQIRKLLPNSTDQCWIVSNECNDISLYNRKGTQLQSVHVGETVSGICRSMGRLLLTLPNSRKVVTIENGEISTIVHTDVCQPIDVASFKDGRFVVVGIDDSGPTDKGIIRIYSSDGEIICDFVKPSLNPHSVSVSASVGSIYISNLKSSSVDVWMDNGTELSRYKGGRTRRRRFLFDESDEQFLPLGSCTNLNGYIIVIDGGSSLLHVLDPGGNFVGPILAAADNIFGDPHCIAVDPGGNIWMGDANNGTVKIFEIISYVNMLGDSSDDE